MEEGGSRTAGVITASQSQAAPSASTSTANGKSSTKPGMTKKAQSPTHRDGSSSSDVFVGVAAMLMGSKSKGKGKQKESSNKKSEKQNGCDDDLPLGSEAHSLSLEYATNTESKYPLPEDKRSKWHKTNSQSLLGWQSFNSDVSNQTSASSASLEQLLNDRQVDPEEMLLNLGFGGESQSLMPSLARVPERFLQHPSRAYGITSTGCSEEEIDNIPDAATQLPSTNPQSGGSAAVMAPARKRTGGFSLKSCDGYVSLVSLLDRDVPHYFFNIQGSKCYCVSPLQDNEIKGQEFEDGNKISEDYENEIYLFISERESIIKMKPGRRDSVGTNNESCDYIESALKVVITSPTWDDNDFDDKMNKNWTASSDPGEIFQPDLRVSLNGTSDCCEMQHAPSCQSKKLYDENQHQHETENNQTKNKQKFINTTQMIKATAQNIGNLIYGTVTNNSGCPKDKKPSTNQERTSHGLSHIQRLHQNVTTSYANLTSKLGRASSSLSSAKLKPQSETSDPLPAQPTDLKSNLMQFVQQFGLSNKHSSPQKNLNISQENSEVPQSSSDYNSLIS